MNSSRTPRGRGFSLIEILVVAVILVALSAFVMNNYLGGSHTPGVKAAPTPIGRAHETECSEYLRQVRMSIDMQKNGDVDGKFPQTLDELKLGNEVTHCPAGKEPYTYNPQTGEVHCPHPGHEKL